VLSLVSVCGFFCCVAVKFGIFGPIKRAMGPLCKVLPLIGFSDECCQFFENITVTNFVSQHLLMLSESKMLRVTVLKIVSQEIVKLLIVSQ